ncbi:MAG: SAM-dependent methyltransferase [Candidatus Tyloplasma litorale]|nr:MAG: SAM-dependent methyltransferase [Mycoplasmatales bacterium]
MKYKRLSFIKSLINKDEFVLDVGTDHALIPIFLFKDKITQNIIASDINEEPLKMAQKNIIKNNLDKKIKIIVSNGIEKIDVEKIDVIVIAGMGGDKISEIISQKKFNGRYILHPTTNFELVRERLSKINFYIKNEWIIKERKIFNLIIEAIPGTMNLSKKELFMGPSLIYKKDKEIIDYYKYNLKIFNDNSIKSKNINFKKNEREWLKDKLWNEKN